MEQQLVELRKQYFAVCSLNSIKPTITAILNLAVEHRQSSKDENDTDTFDSCLQEEIISDTVENASVRYHPPKNYQYRFLKMLIEELEKRDMELVETLWKLTSSLCQQITEKGEGYKSYFLPNGDIVSFSHHRCLLSGGTTGLTTWDAAYFMVDFMMDNAHLITKRKIVELGAGSGLTGIILTKILHPSAYALTDYHEAVLEQLQHNLRLNNLHEDSRVSVEALDWLNVDEIFLQSLDIDLVVACDIAYDPSIIAPFFRVLQLLRSSRRNDLDIFVCLKIRNPATKELFYQTAAKNHFHLEEKRFTMTSSVFPIGAYDPNDCVVVAVK